MGIFDFLKKSNPPPGAPTYDKKVAGPAKVAADKRAQTYDRLEAIQALAAMKTADSASALIKRFSFSIDPSITDQEEKDIAYQGILDALHVADLPKDETAREKALEEVDKRREQVLEALRTFCERAEQLTWPLKLFRELLGDEEYGDELLLLLDRFDTEYARNVEPKIQIIAALEEIKRDDVRIAVEEFLEDVNETVRFHAVETTVAQDNTASVPLLVKLLENEESVRVKNKVAERLLKKGWGIPADLRDLASKSLADTDEYAVGSDGKVVKRSSRFGD